MTKLELYKRLIAKAKENGYTGPDYVYELGFIVNGTNIYSVIFREDFAKAIWGEWVVSNLSMPTDDEILNSTRLDGTIKYWPSYRKHLVKLLLSEDKWKYLEENAL